MPGACGELVQGSLNGIPFHVSCPVDLYSTVEVELSGEPGVLEHAAGSPKSAPALRSFLKGRGLDGMGGRITITSDLPRSKGMASSTADVAGTVYAAARALEVQLTPQEVARLALDIEPTGGSLFSNIVLFDHRQGQLWEDLGPCPDMDILVLDFGGEVDTMAFNRMDCSDILQQTEPQVAEALSLVREGLATKDLVLIGQGATLSAFANQFILFKPQLESLIVAAEEVEALGINVAHSGTVVGVLLDPSWHDVEEVGAWLEPRLPGLNFIRRCRLTGGGAVSVE